jgi:hypothetical protein
MRAKTGRMRLVLQPWQSFLHLRPPHTHTRPNSRIQESETRHTLCSVLGVSDKF